MKKAIVCLGLALAAAGCEQEQPVNVETQKRIAACEEVMKLYMTQGRVYERDRKRLIGSCQISQSKRTLAQWECTLQAMQKGTLFKNASDDCGAKDAGTP